MAWAIITIYISKCAQMEPQQLPKTSKFYFKCKKCDIEKTLGGWVPPPLVARRLKPNQRQQVKHERDGSGRITLNAGRNDGGLSSHILRRQILIGSGHRQNPYYKAPVMTMFVYLFTANMPDDIPRIGLQGLMIMFIYLLYLFISK